MPVVNMHHKFYLSLNKVIWFFWLNQCFDVWSCKVCTCKYLSVFSSQPTTFLTFFSKSTSALPLTSSLFHDPLSGPHWSICQTQFFSKQHFLIVIILLFWCIMFCCCCCFWCCCQGLYMMLRSETFEWDVVTFWWVLKRAAANEICAKEGQSL